MAVAVEFLVKPARDDTIARRTDFARLYEATHGRLLALCDRLLAGQGDAEAVAQEVYLKAWRAWGSYSPNRPFWPWLATIARRLCIDEARRRDRRQPRRHFEATLTGQFEPGPEEFLDLAEESRAAAAALRKLRPDQQRLVLLREVDEWSYGEIAEFEGATVEAVRSSLKRSRAALRKAFERVVEGLPSLVGFGYLRTLRHRADVASARAQEHLAIANPVLARAGDVIAGAITVVVVTATAAGSTPSAQALESAEPTLVRSSVGLAGDTVKTGTLPFSGGVAAGAPLDGGNGDADTTVIEAPPPHDGELDDDGPAPVAPSSPIDLKTPFLGDPSEPPPEVRAQRPSDGGHAPEDAAFNGFAVPANGGSTVFATGVVGDGCSFPPCLALFRSADAGATWNRLAAEGWRGGQVLVPPDHPSDDRIFSTSDSNLQVSNDGGATFHDVATVGGPAAMSPAFSEGDPRIFLGASPVWEYDDRTGTTRPLALAPPPPAAMNSIALAPSFPADPTMFVGTMATTESGSKTAAVYRCSDSLCETTYLPHGGRPDIEAFEDPSGNTVVFAWTGKTLSRSDDGGASFETVTLPEQADVSGMAASGDGRLFLALRRVGDVGTDGGLFVSDDGGVTWRPAGGPFLARGVNAVEVLADGRVLAAPTGAGGGGMYCSTNSGRTWAPRC